MGDGWIVADLDHGVALFDVLGEQFVQVAHLGHHETHAQVKIEREAPDTQLDADVRVAVVVANRLEHAQTGRVVAGNHSGEPVGVMDIPQGPNPELYLELRRVGQPINPLPWLATTNNKVQG